MVHYNAPELLHRCLSAVAAQSRRPDRTLLVDNGSDQFPRAEIEQAFPWVEVIALDRNIGFAAANNLAAARAPECDFIALLNPDAFPEPDWLGALLAAAAAAPEAGSFSSRLLKAGDPTHCDGTGDLYHVSGLARRRDEGKPALDAERPAGEVFSACAAAALYRRDAFDAAGGFDERFFCYFEDVDLGLRLRLLGWGCRYVPGSVALHVGSAVTVRRSDFSVYYGHRNLVWTFVKGMPPAIFWPVLPIHLLLNLVTIVRYGLAGRLGVVLRAKRDALAALPTLWRERQALQRRRRICALGLLVHMRWLTLE